MLDKKSNAFTEEAWKNSGGGFSQFYTLPSYQQHLPEATQKLLQGHRGIPDIAASAVGIVPIYLSGRWELLTGTSASAPLWAAIVAIANQAAGHPLGFVNPTLYQLGSSAAYKQDFRDIVTGDNMIITFVDKDGKFDPKGKRVEFGYKADPDWDAVTGWGAPDAANLVPHLVAAAK